MDRRAFLTRVVGAVAGLVAIRAAVPEQVQAVDGVEFPEGVARPGNLRYAESGFTGTVTSTTVMTSGGWQGSEYIGLHFPEFTISGDIDDVEIATRKDWIWSTR